MELAKDLAWQKYLEVAQRIRKSKKRVFFCFFATLTRYFISFPDTQWAYKITTENINTKRSLNRLKKNYLFSPISFTFNF